MDITTFARGFLARIGANAQGVGIRQGSDVLAPVIDIDRYLGLGFRRTFGFSVVNNVVANQFLGNSAIVPNGKVWKLLQMSAWMVTGAGVTTAGSVFGFRPPDRATTNNHINALSNGVNGPASTTLGLGYWQGEIFLPGGTELGCYHAAVAAGPNGTVNMFAVVEEFDG